MNAITRERPLRKGVRRAVVFLPNGFTLFNLFCGIQAIVLASRGSYDTAALWTIIGGFADAVDGRVARATGTGSRMGEELDSLVDAISFGLAPAMITYFWALRQTDWQWVFVFLFVACAVMRLARFNVEQAGRSKTYFHGLPSPAAGITLASYQWFGQTPLYNDVIILFTDQRTLAQLPWNTIMPWLMVILAFLMVSNVPYPALPKVGFRNRKQLLGGVIVLGSIVLFIITPRQFVFPACVAYVAFGLLQSIFGVFGRRPVPEAIYWDKPAEVVLAAEGNLSRERESRERLSPERVSGERGSSEREPREPREPRERGGRGRGRGRGSRGDRPDRADRADRPDRPARTDRPDRESSPAPLPRPRASEEDELFVDDGGGLGASEAAEAEAQERRRRRRRRRPRGGPGSESDPGRDTPDTPSSE